MCVCVCVCIYRAILLYVSRVRGTCVSACECVLGTSMWVCECMCLSACMSACVRVCVCVPCVCVCVCVCVSCVCAHLVCLRVCLCVYDNPHTCPNPNQYYYLYDLLINTVQNVLILQVPVILLN